MKNPPSAPEMSKKVDKFLESQGFDVQDTDQSDKLAQIIKMLETSRNTQNALYSWEPAHGTGLVRGLKNFILKKIKNVVVNILEKYINRQQKFNELTYQALVEIQASMDKPTKS